MARIRSIHPGQWTDGDFLSCSAAARLLALAIRNEADDNGVFAWNPVDLKIRLLPADNVDVAALLDELVAHRQVLRFEHAGRAFGAIRNFRKWQRPEKPKTIHPIDDNLLAWVGLSPMDRRPVADQSPKSSAEEGGRRKEEGCRREKSTPAKAGASPSGEGEQLIPAEKADPTPTRRASRRGTTCAGTRWASWRSRPTPGADTPRKSLAGHYIVQQETVPVASPLAALGRP